MAAEKSTGIQTPARSATGGGAAATRTTRPGDEVGVGLNHLHDCAMKLLTHNLLECHIKGVTNKYPFLVEAQQVEQTEVDFNPGERSLGYALVASYPKAEPQNLIAMWGRLLTQLVNRVFLVLVAFASAADFLRRMYPKLDWKAFKDTAEGVSLCQLGQNPANSIQPRRPI